MDALALTRRSLLALALAGLTAPVVVGCSAGELDLAEVDVARQPPDAKPADPAIAALLSFTGATLDRLAGEQNLICSPLSVWIALAMIRNGALGITATEMDRALRFPPIGMLNSSLNTLTQTLAQRSGKRSAGDRKGSVELDVASQVWGERSLEWTTAFLTALARYYGTGVAKADLAGHPDQARKAINAWVADATHDKITEIVTAQTLTTDARLVLANAIYLKAPWLEPFRDAVDGPFRTDGGSVTAAMMHLNYHGLAAHDDGWTAAQIPYLGGELAMTVILPDEGSENDVRRGLPQDLLQQVFDALEPATTITLTMPRFTFGTAQELTPPLQVLGMRTAFTPDADFSGLTADEALMIAHVLHKGWIAVDEQGTEAAAATAVVAGATSAPANERRIDLTLDRPFWFVISDVATRAPLLAGRVADPTADS